MRIVRYCYPSSRNFAPIPSGFARSPWTGLESQIDQLFETALGESAPAAPSANRFPVDLYEDKDHTFVRAALPGLSRENIGVELADGILTLTAVRKTPATEGRAEESVSFSRAVNIPAEVQADRVGAAYENGVLTVTLPKREESKPKKITVAVK